MSRNQLTTLAVVLSVGAGLGYLVGSLPVPAQQETDKAAASIQLIDQAALEKDAAALQGRCESGTVKALPTGSIAFCTDDTKWHVPTGSQAPRVELDRISQEEIDADRAILAGAQLVDQGVKLSDSKGCLWFVWEASDKLNHTRFKHHDGSPICDRPQAN
jgi:hypothetical protein